MSGRRWGVNIRSAAFAEDGTEKTPLAVRGGVLTLALKSIPRSGNQPWRALNRGFFLLMT